MADMAHGGAAQGYRLNGEVGYGLPVGGRFCKGHWLSRWAAS